MHGAPKPFITLLLFVHFIFFFNFLTSLQFLYLLWCSLDNLMSNDPHECTLDLHNWHNEWPWCNIVGYVVLLMMLFSFEKKEWKNRHFLTINPLFLKPTLLHNEKFDGCRTYSLEPDKAAMAWKQKVAEPSTSSRTQNKVNNFNWYWYWSILLLLSC